MAWPGLLPGEQLMVKWQHGGWGPCRHADTALASRQPPLTLPLLTCFVPFAALPSSSSSCSLWPSWFCPLLRVLRALRGFAIRGSALFFVFFVPLVVLPLVVPRSSSCSLCPWWFCPWWFSCLV